MQILTDRQVGHVPRELRSLFKASPLALTLLKCQNRQLGLEKTLAYPEKEEAKEALFNNQKV